MKIICIGRNYADHAKELGNAAPTHPIFFLKPDTALLRDNKPFYYPSFSENIHYECELVVRISSVGKSIEERFAHKYYNEIGLGIDFTARDIQAKCKENNHPWEIAKGFDNSAPISNKFLQKTELNLKQLDFSLEKNGKIVQQGNTADMLFSIDAIITYVSQFITLKIGDLIFTGTPSGVSQIQIGDKLCGYIGKERMLDFEIK